MSFTKGFKLLVYNNKTKTLLLFYLLQTSALLCIDKTKVNMFFLGVGLRKRHLRWFVTIHESKCAYQYRTSRIKRDY